MFYKIVFSIIIFSSFHFYAFTQTENERISGNTVYSYVDQMPEFQGDLSEYIAENLIYPLDAYVSNIEGRVVVKFVIDTNGSVKDIEIIRSIYPSLDMAAIAVVRKMPLWKPGRMNGKTVKVSYTLPIIFRLTDPYPKK